ncbi:MAG: transcription antiterminator [Erysipelotrichaceae bacterium]|nr:transcription antiterminator [Erysipelotrichaceae bacterium]
MKKTARKQLLSLLLNSDYITSEQIASQLSVSYKTAQQMCRELSDDMQGHGVNLTSKKGKGYKLEITDPKLFQVFYDGPEHGFIPVYPAERISYLIWSMIQGNYVKTADISEEMYVSASTVTNDLREVEILIGKYNLTLERRPHYGMRIEGREYDKRRCLAECMKDARYIDLSDLLNAHERANTISSLLKENLEHGSFRVSAVAFNELLNHIIIQIDRIKKGYLIEKDFRQITDEKSLQLAARIAQNIGEEADVRFTPEEINYLGLLLLAKQTVVSERGGNLAFDSSVMELANDMIDSVYDAFNVDLRDDLELKMTLCQHLIPLKIRMENGISSQNPILDEIRREYPLSNVMAAYAAKVINQRYRHNLSEEEIGFIALTFALAMEKKKMTLQKKNICLITSYGRMNSLLMEYQIISNLSEYVSSVHSIDTNDIDTYDFSQTDYVFSTVPIEKDIPVPIMQMSSLNSEQQIEFMKKIFKKGRESEVLAVFSPDLFVREKSRDKKTIIRNMCDLIQSHETIEGLYEAVLRREEAGNTVFCNQVALSHPDRAMAQKAMICVSVLDEPIEWEGGKPVNVIFLVCIARDAQDNLREMYQCLSKIVTDRNYIDQLIRNPEYSTMQQIISEISQKN